MFSKLVSISKRIPSKKMFNNKYPYKSSLSNTMRKSFLNLSFEIKNLFDFIPQYLIDDVMISLSNIKGSVGKHKDNYSVFLIQGKGIKNWKIYENKKTSFLKVFKKK